LIRSSDEAYGIQKGKEYPDGRYYKELSESQYGICGRIPLHVDRAAMHVASHATLADRTQKFGVSVQLATIPLKFQSGWPAGLLKSQAFTYHYYVYVMHRFILLVTRCNEWNGAFHYHGGSILPSTGGSIYVSVIE
jgi:hypothetical protein